MEYSEVSYTPFSQNQKIQQPAKKFHKEPTQSSTNPDFTLDQAIKKSTVKNFIKKRTNIPQDGIKAECQSNTGLQAHLQHLKKSCNELIRQIKCKQQQASKCKDESLFTFDKSKRIKQSRQQLEQKIAQTQKKLQVVNLKRQTAFHSSKTYEHILQRMKKDGIHLQLHKNYLERQLKALEKTFQSRQNKNHHVTQFQKLSAHGLKDAHEELQEQNNSRKNQLNNVKNQVKKKIDDQFKLLQRQRQTEQIQQLAADDIQDADLLRLKKYTKVQVFLRQMLKLKISRLKKHYQPYQNAFFRIKSNTSVKDSRSLKSQFFKFDQSYNQKIQWVKGLQSLITQSEQKRTKLREQLLQSRNQQMELIEQQQKKEKLEQIVNNRQLNEKSMNHELILQRIQSWVLFQCKRMNVTDKDHQNLVGLFKQIINKLQKQQYTKNNEKNGEQQTQIQAQPRQKQKSVKLIRNQQKNKTIKSSQ